MFYARRAKRILPALLLVVSFVWIVGWFMAAPTQFRDIGGGLLGNSYFTVNFWLLRLAGVGGYFGADATTKPLLHLWSLSIEEQFYLVWSVLLLALFKLRAAARLHRHSRPVRRLVRVQRFPHSDRSDRRVLPALDARMGTRARRADRLSRGLLARGAALSVATDRQHRRGARNRADARRLPVPERDAALSRMARGDPDTWLRAGHRQSAIRFRARSRSAIAWPASSARSPIRSICGTGLCSPSPASGPA